MALAGTFNGWSTNAVAFTRNGRGIWKAKIPMPSPGKYLYKFVLDNKVWLADPENVFREPDEFNALNSWFTID